MMDKTALVQEVANLFRLNGHSVEISVRIGHREIDILAKEIQGLIKKTVLIECADYGGSVGVAKLQEDELKLASARAELRENAVLVHVSRHGYTADAAGYALNRGLDIMSLANLQANLINFTKYVEHIESDRLRAIITREYQPTTAHLESSAARLPAIGFIDNWLNTDSNYLIVLGDYGVGKSWLLRRYLYTLLDRYKANPSEAPLPFFIPLQRFTKAFDFENLVLRSFETYGLSGAHYGAFTYMLREGRVILLLDSFDEMAQHLSRNTIRENLTAIFSVATEKARIVMTSRPNYFENRSERLLLVDRFDPSQLHPLDLAEINHQAHISETLNSRLSQAQFARLDDLTTDQRTRLFSVVLDGKPAALEALTGLLRRFQSLANLSQRAVIARLLTTVAETIAVPGTITTYEGSSLVPNDLNEINEAKIFEIVLFNLLRRDQGIGTLSASERHRFLKALARYLQRRGSDFFATPDEVRDLVRKVFSHMLGRTDTPEQELESLYRVCRRHSGLTTEGQFYDTSGVIDLPVSEEDLDSRIGFSHNSLREYLVATSIIDTLKKPESGELAEVSKVALSEQINRFIIESSVYDPGIRTVLMDRYAEFGDSRITAIAFGALYYMYIASGKKGLDVFGVPARFRNSDLSLSDFSGVNLSDSEVMNSLLQDTDFTGTALRRADFGGSILDKVRLDGADLIDTNFVGADISSIYVYDEFETQTTGILSGRSALQWLHSRGAKVENAHSLNPYLGKPWYHAAREVTRTLVKRIAGTHEQSALVKGTSLKYRDFASQFVEFLVGEDVLTHVMKSRRTDGWVVKLNSAYRAEISAFSADGVIGPTLRTFFERNRL